MEPIERKTAAGLSVVGLIALALAWVSYRDARGFIEASQSLARTHEVLTELEAVVGTMADAETGSRGYLITEQESYLEPYNAAIPKVRERLDHLKQLTADNPRQQQRLLSLESASAEKLALIQQAIELKRQQGSEAAQDFLSTGREQRAMEQLRRTVAEMEQEEKDLLARRERDFAAGRRKTTLAFSVVLLMEFALLGLVYYGFTRYITESKRMAETLRESEERYRILLECARDYAILMLSPTGHVASWNSGAEGIKRYKAEEIIGQHFSCFYSREDIESGKPDRELQIAAAKGRVEDEGWRVRKDGSRFWANVVITALRDANGKLRGFSKATRDNSQWKQAEEARDRHAIALTQANSELAATNKELEAFTYSVSHDLRAPLRHIDGFSKILLEEEGPKLDSDTHHYLMRIREATQHMGCLVDDLLNLARLGRQELSLQATGLNSVAQKVVQDLTPEIQDRKVEFRIGRLPFVECDPALMHQVFLNLLSNAVKYTRPREQAIIEVDQTTVNGGSAIYVRDNGVGFSMKYADKLFGAFQRLHRQEDFEGTGVGLATVKRIIHKHGGRVWAEAELDKGATFYFTLGVAEKAGSGTAPPAAERS